MTYKIIDNDRKESFEFFKTFTIPFFNVNYELDITELHQYIKETNLRFFASILYLMLQTCNDVKEFRYRLRNDNLIEYDKVPISYTHINQKKELNFFRIEYTDNFNIFMEKYVDLESAVNDRTIKLPKNEEDDAIRTSSSPWLTFKSVTPPVNMNCTSPIIIWGKFYKDFNNRIVIPISVTAHHSLMDGIHISMFNESFSENMRKFIAEKSY